MAAAASAPAPTPQAKTWRIELREPRRGPDGAFIGASMAWRVMEEGLTREQAQARLDHHFQAAGCDPQWHDTTAQPHERHSRMQLELTREECGDLWIDMGGSVPRILPFVSVRMVQVSERSAPAVVAAAAAGTKRPAEEAEAPQSKRARPEEEEEAPAAAAAAAANPEREAIRQFLAVDPENLRAVLTQQPDGSWKHEDVSPIFFRRDVVGPYLFLSNSWPEVVGGGKQRVFDAHPGVLQRGDDYSFAIDGVAYHTAEQAFYSLLWEEELKGLQLLAGFLRPTEMFARSRTPSQIKRVHKTLEKRHDKCELSAEKRVALMKRVIDAKFCILANPGLCKALVATGDRALHETSGQSAYLWTWPQGDQLGKLLMARRAELKAMGVPNVGV